MWSLSLMSTFVDDFKDMSTEQKFMLMLVERIGAIEEVVCRMQMMLTDLYEHLVHDLMFSSMNLPIDAFPDDASTIADRVAAAIQEIDRVRVKHVWVVVHPGLRPPPISIFVRLDKRIMVEHVSAAMNKKLSIEFGVTPSHFLKWNETSLECVEHCLEGGLSGKPVVYEKSF